MNRLLTALLLLCLAISGATAQTYRQVNNVSYTKKTDAYSAERLKLDIYYPEGQTGCPVVVWFHGGGLEAGSKEIPAKLKEKGYVVVGANYRLLPKVTAKETIDDAAEAVAWVFNHIGEYGGDVKKIVVTGHSAGGYLAMMLCLNKAWLQAYGIDADQVMMSPITTSARCRASPRCSPPSTSMPHSTGCAKTVRRWCSSAATASLNSMAATTKTSIWHA